MRVRVTFDTKRMSSQQISPKVFNHSFLRQAWILSPPKKSIDPRHHANQIWERETKAKAHDCVYTAFTTSHRCFFLFSMFFSLALCDHNHHTHFISGLWPEDMNSVRKIRLKIHGVRFVVLYNCTQTIPFKCEEKSNKLNRPKPDWTFNVHKNNGKRSLRPGSEKQVKLKTIESANSNGFSLFCTLWLCVGRQRWECVTTMASYAYERIQNLTKMLPFSLL